MRDQILEDTAALFIAGELIETGAGGGEQNGIAGMGLGAGLAHGGVESAALDEGDGAFQMPGDFFRRGTDEQRGAGLGGERRAQRTVVAALVLAAQNDPQRTVEGGD